MRAAELGQTVETKHGMYRVYAPGGGPQLWVGCVSVDGEQQFTCATPHYSGEARMRFGAERVELDEETPLEGLLHGWADPSTSAGDDGAYPIAIAVPDAAAVAAQLKVPCVVDIQVSAIAESIELFRDRDHFEQVSWGIGGHKMAPESLIPVGSFAGERPSTALFCGEIVRVANKVNTDAGARYWHLLVRTLGGEFDVVAAPDQIDGNPAAGGLVQMNAWLSARVVSPHSLS